MDSNYGKNHVFRVEKYLTRKILGFGLGRSWSRILKVSEGVVSVSNGMVLVSVSDDKVSVLDDEAETPWN